VRMQIIKELTESPNDVYIDYVPLVEPDRNGQRRALSLVVRKEMIHGIQEACKSAGLKLLGITARAFGIAACIKRLAGSHAQVPAPPAADAVVGVLTVSKLWAEFTAVRGDQLLFARALTVGDGLFGEVRRNLAAYSGQPQLTFPRDAIQALYVAGDGENAALREKLQGTLGIPVHGLDPFVKEERIDVGADARAGFTGVAGLLQLWAQSQTLPVNFVKPREAKPVTSPAKKRVLIYGALAAALVATFVFGALSVVAGHNAQLDDLREQKITADKQLKDLQPEAKYLEALGEWVAGDVSDLDEMYDLVARTPWMQGFRVTKVEKTVIQQTKVAKEKDKDSKEKFLVRLDITGRMFRKDLPEVQAWLDRINRDPHCKAKSDTTKMVTNNQNDSSQSVHEFKITVEIARQAGEKFTSVLRPPSTSR
jgi:hypothetical protein